MVFCIIITVSYLVMAGTLTCDIGGDVGKIKDVQQKSVLVSLFNKI